MIKDPFFRNRLIRDGIYRAIHAKMRQDPRIHLIGEGAQMKIRFDAPEILAEFPDRIVTLPICEDSNSNVAVGMALAGLVPVCDFITSDFGLRTFDAICNTAAKQSAVGEPRTMVFRGEFLTAGPTTGQRLEGLFARIPGLSVVVPSNPVDACGLMLTALEHKGVTIFFEDRMIEDAATEDDEKSASPGAFTNWAKYCGAPSSGVPFGKAMLRRPGPDLTVVSYGLMTRRLDSILRKFDCDHIDLRTLWPLDMEAILKSVQKTETLLVVEPDVRFMGIGAEIVAQVAEYETVNMSSRGWRFARLGGPRATIPAARELHERMLPSDEEILAAVRRMTS
jgi:pyruvate dehydrogenase E1 component beta subunit